ncbi:MAG: hypothetical protein LBC20_12285 [Planctomycetaceae bacterium]|jgi:hypothetical protein|nr:hypothetical protein [Planctomycetaceae bacterium]
MLNRNLSVELLFFDFYPSGTPKVVNISPKRFKQYGNSRPTVGENPLAKRCLPLESIGKQIDEYSAEILQKIIKLLYVY